MTSKELQNAIIAALFGTAVSASLGIYSSVQKAGAELEKVRVQAQIAKYQGAVAYLGDDTPNPSLDSDEIDALDKLFIQVIEESQGD